MINKKLWVGVYLASLLIVVAILFVEGVLGVLLYDGIVHPGKWAVPMIALGSFAYLQFVLVHTITTLTILYKIWAVIQDGDTPVTPGKAIGFLFVPIYNIYWIFRVWGGYATEYDNYVLRHDLTIAPLAGTVFLFYPIFAILGGLFLFPAVVLPFLLFPMIGKACDAVNDLRTANGIA